ncbi:MAG: glycosyltransferase family 87 protein, partial [Candidatus Dormibacteria bacterium]
MRTRTPVAALLAAVSALALSLQLFLWAGLSSAQVRTSDYTCTYIAARTWLAGNGAHLYDRAVQLAGHLALHTAPGAAGLGFVNPPLAAVVASPFSVLGFDASYRAFGLFQLFLVLAAVIIAMRAAPWPESTPRLMKVAIGMVAFAGTGTGVTLYLAQWDGVGALGLALGYAAWRRQRPGWAAVAIVLAFGLTKPHLALGLVAFLIARGERRSLWAALAAAAGMIAASVLLVGVHGTAGFLSAPGISSGVSPLPTMLGLSGLVYSNLHQG